MRVFNGPLMSMRVTILEIRHRQLLYSSEPIPKITPCFTPAQKVAPFHSKIYFS